MIPQCLDQGVGVIPWSPLARGLLAGNRTREGERLTTRARTDPFGDCLYTPELDFAVVDRAGEVAAARGVPAAQVALAWLLHRPGVTAPIVGATKLEHLEDALAAERSRSTATRSRGSRSPTSRTPSPASSCEIHGYSSYRRSAMSQATISAAPSSTPASRGTTGKTLSREQNRMSSSRPGGP